MLTFDKYTQHYQYAEHHNYKTLGDFSKASTALLDLKVEDLPGLKLLMTLRGLFSNRGALQRSDNILSMLRHAGFHHAYTIENTFYFETCYLVISKFWKLKNDGVIPIVTTDEYVNFQHAHYAKLAIKFTASRQGNGSIKLSTCTRIIPTSKKANRFFGIYWYIIRLFSGYIRRQWLKAWAKKLKYH